MSDKYKNTDGFVISGYSQAFNYLLQQVFKFKESCISFRLNCPCTKITHSTSGVVCKYVNIDELVTKTVHSRAVFCCVPLPVLKQLDFEPSLSSMKSSCLQKLKMGVENKLFLRFKKSFWPKVPYFHFFGHSHLRFINYC